MESDIGTRGVKKNAIVVYFVHCKWVHTQWQQYSTHLHINSTQNNTMKQNTQNRTYITIRIHKHNNKNT
jgi:hypothetical protein